MHRLLRAGPQHHAQLLCGTVPHHLPHQVASFGPQFLMLQVPTRNQLPPHAFRQPFPLQSQFARDEAPR